MTSVVLTVTKKNNPMYTTVDIRLFHIYYKIYFNVILIKENYFKIQKSRLYKEHKRENQALESYLNMSYAP